jgi:LCP family protein required for cell wall assembly
VTSFGDDPLVAWRTVSTAGHHRRRARRSWPQRLLLTGGVLIVTACLLAAAGVWYAKHRLDNIETIPLGSVLTPEGGTVPGQDQAAASVENYLIVGSDSRDGSNPDDADYMQIVGTETHVGRRSDTIMILRYDSATNTGALLSLPRDLYVEIAGSDSQNRINSAFFKGPDVLVKTVTESLGIPVHHYVEVDFQGFKRIVDAIGGVSLWFDAPVRDGNTGLRITETGCVKLDGLAALQYARSRHLETKVNGRWREDGTGDLGRISRQQDFIRRALEKAISRGMSNPLVLNDLIGAAVDNLRIDDQLDLWSFASRLQSLQGAQLASYTVPADGKFVKGNAVLIMNEEQAEPILDFFRGSSAKPTNPPKASAATGATSPTTAAPAAPPTTARPIGTVPGADKDCE